MTAGEDPRHRLLDVAGQKFAEKGFDATNVREITEAAGMNVASVNYHFGSKEELYVEAVRHAARTCMQTTPMPTWPEGVPAEERLRDFIRAFLTRLLREDTPVWHRLLIMREVAEPRPGACEEFVRGFVRPTFEVLQNILHELTPAGSPTEALHLTGASIVGQCLHYHHARHVMRLLLGEEEYRRNDLEVLTEHIWRFSLAAVRGMFARPGKGDRR
jgi:TetR/AcrR family transcriptional regulator, regulator of cefoperazone and chloramphenicol sensitivity